MDFTHTHFFVEPKVQAYNRSQLYDTLEGTVDLKCMALDFEAGIEGVLFLIGTRLITMSLTGYIALASPYNFPTYLHDERAWGSYRRASTIHHRPNFS
jgi:hypothetical protein